MSNVLKGKIALVLEGTKGIGLASAKEFSIQGAKVFVTGRSQREVDNAINIIGNDVVGLQADSSNLAELDIVMSHVKHMAGHLDILVTDAKEGGDCCSVDDLSQELQASLAHGADGKILSIGKAMPLLKDGSSIIIVFHRSSKKTDNTFKLKAEGPRNLARTWLLKLTPEVKFVPVLF